MTLMRTSGSEDLFERYLSAVSTQWRVILSLFLRETKTRYAGSPIGYAWEILDPLFQIILWSAIFVALDRKPPLGDSMIIFILTAYLPLMLLRNLSVGLSRAITDNRPLLFFPVVQNSDVIFARALLGTVTTMFLMLLFFSVLWILGFNAIPINPLGALAAVSAMVLIGTGWGYFNAIVSTQMRSWPRLVSWVNRVLFFTSGMFFYPGMLPKPIQDILWYFPVTHLVDWFRAMFFYGYNSDFFVTWPMIFLGGWGLLIGMAMERVLRRRVDTQ
jgi:capsular polysaccharide transport system permease protein